MKKIWRDIHITRILLIICFSLFGFLFIYLFFKDTSYYAIQHWIIGLIFCLAPFAVVSHIIRTRLIFITEQGIRVGNAKTDMYDKMPSGKLIFINWADIEYITIIRKEVKHNFVLFLVPFLIVKSKSGKKYECFIARPKSFIKSLKNLKKEKLISKDSKYLDN